jgi:hypothetical protein
MLDGERQQVHVGHLAGSVNAQRIHVSSVDDADVIGPEFVQWIECGFSQSLHDRLDGNGVGYAAWLMMRTHPFCVIGHDDQPLPACSANQSVAGT